MFSRFVSAAVVMFVVTGLLLAGEYTGVITKLTDKECTIKIKGKKKGDKAEEKTFKVGSGVKITKKTKDADEDLTVEGVTKLIEGAEKLKGVFGTITTDGEGDAEKVTKIVVGRKGKKKKDS